MRKNTAILILSFFMIFLAAAVYIIRISVLSFQNVDHFELTGKIMDWIVFMSLVNLVFLVLILLLLVYVMLLAESLVSEPSSSEKGNRKRKKRIQQAPKKKTWPPQEDD